MLRLDSRCKECRKTARRLARLSENKRVQDAELCKQWREKNKVKQVLYAKMYRSSEHGRQSKARMQRMRAAKSRADYIELSAEERRKIKYIYEDAAAIEQKLRDCVNCDDDLLLQMHVDHIIPISRGGMHHPDNLQILSARENLEKGCRVATN